VTKKLKKQGIAIQQGGFTLLEVLLATVLLAIIATLASTTLWATFRTQRTINERTELQDIGTAAIYKIREDLSQTFHVETSRPLTLFRGEDNGNEDEIDFTSLSRSIISPSEKESDQTEITYKTVSDPEYPKFQSLLRRETPYIDGVVEDNDQFVTLATNVTGFNIRYHDGDQFRSEWDIRSQEHLNKLPKMVEVVLSLADKHGREEFFETLIVIPMSEDLSFVGKASKGTPPKGQSGTSKPPGSKPGSSAPIGQGSKGIGG